MKTNFKIIGDVKSKQRPRAAYYGGHARVYTPKDTINYENYIRSEYQRQCPNVHFGDLPLKMNIVAYFKPSQELAKLSGFTDVACFNKKDIDNIAKIVMDGLQNGCLAMNDDRQVVELYVAKKYTDGDYEYIDVTIESIEDYCTIDELKDKIRKDKIIDRLNKLLIKDKLTKSDREKIQSYKKMLNIED